MANQTHTTGRRYVYKTMNSPVGKLTLVAAGDGLARVLWENDPPRRVPLTLDAEDNQHPCWSRPSVSLANTLPAGARPSPWRSIRWARRFNAKSGARC